MIRRRRLRASENLRALVRETSVSASDLIYPVFVIEGKDIKNPIDSMPGIYQYSIDRLDEELDRIREAGVKEFSYLEFLRTKMSVEQKHIMNTESFRKRFVTLKRYFLNLSLSQISVFVNILPMDIVE